VARKARPSACGRTLKLQQPAITATATANVSSGRRRPTSPGRAAWTGGFDRAGLQPLAVGGEARKQPVLDDDRQAEGDQQRRQDVVADQRAVQQPALQRIAEREHQRHRQINAVNGSTPSASHREQQRR
jgi:hypothetical protein